MLKAAARGGGGSYLAWVPGLTVETAALAALESTNGAQLRDATIELPAGLADVAPTELPTIRSGEEVLVAARLRHVAGTKWGTRRYMDMNRLREQRDPEATTTAAA